MNVLFVNPPNTTTFRYTEPSKYIEENIGINYFPIPRTPFKIMASLKELNEINKDILLLDYEWYKNPLLSNEDLINQIVKRKPDVVLTSLISTSNSDSIDYLTSSIKKKLPKIKIILGGQGAETLEEKVFKFIPNVDSVVFGNIKNNLILILNRIVSGESFPKFQGLMSENLIEENYSPEQMYNPFSNLLNEIVNNVKNKGAEPIALLENYKGCPFSCDFCAAKKPVTKKKIDSTLEELRYLYNKGISKFYFIDLNFGLYKIETEKLLLELSEFKRLHSNFGFRCVTRSNIVNRNLATYMKKAGCYEVGLGLESGNNDVLEKMNKNSSIEVNWNAINSLGQAGIMIKLFLIEGYKGSSSKETSETFSLLNEVQEKKYPFFVQPALSRDIIPNQEKFEEKEVSGLLKRGTMHQLDFRYDARLFGWDSDKSIRAMCYFMLAYPSTEISQKDFDSYLQKRATLDLPFLVSRNVFSEALKFTNNDIEKQIIHYLDGIYTHSEIKRKISQIYNFPEKNFDINGIINILRSEGLVDSFGNPNPEARIINNSSIINEKNKNPTSSKRILLFWNGKGKRYIYLPKGEKKMSSCLYKEIPEDAFDFLSLAKGVYTLEEISAKLSKLYYGKKGYSSIEEALITTKNIKNIFYKNGFLEI